MDKTLNRRRGDRLVVCQ